MQQELVHSSKLAWDGPNGSIYLVVYGSDSRDSSQLRIAGTE